MNNDKDFISAELSPAPVPHHNGTVVVFKIDIMLRHGKWYGRVERLSLSYKPRRLKRHDLESLAWVTYDSEFICIYVVVVVVVAFFYVTPELRKEGSGNDDRVESVFQFTGK